MDNTLPIELLKFINKLKDNNYHINEDLKYNISELERMCRWYVNEKDLAYRGQEILDNLGIKVRAIHTTKEINDSHNFNAILIDRKINKRKE